MLDNESYDYGYFMQATTGFQVYDDSDFGHLKPRFWGSRSSIYLLPTFSFAKTASMNHVGRFWEFFDPPPPL